jgi:hypothetical protein
MTITEDLEFSVLTAPIAAVDRRALSQAWYSALYTSSERTAVPASAPAKIGKPAPAALPRSAARSAAHSHTAARVNGGKIAPAGQSRGGPSIERRAPRSRLARSIERRFLHPSAAAQKASFHLDGDHGRVQVLLRSAGSRVQLIAICPRRAEAHVAAALAQARYALALRGIDLEARTQEEEA